MVRSLSLVAAPIGRPAISARAEVAGNAQSARPAAPLAGAEPKGQLDVERIRRRIPSANKSQDPYGHRIHSSLRFARQSGAKTKPRAFRELSGADQRPSHFLAAPVGGAKTAQCDIDSSISVPGSRRARDNNKTQTIIRKLSPLGSHLARFGWMSSAGRLFARHPSASISRPARLGSAPI